MDFFVRGIPAPQGSKRHVGNGVMIESSKKVKPWREDVRQAAMAAAGGAAPITGPVRVNVLFHLHKPRTAPKWRFLPMVKPDIDKLVRSTLDALKSAGVYLDDSQVCELYTAKEYSLLSGATITVSEMTRADTQKEEVS